MSPKYHPELAGEGIEYSWARSKCEFRGKINDFVPANLRRNVQRALGPDILSLDFVRKTARRTRDYCRAYSQPTTPQDYCMIERMKKEQKTHRTILNTENKLFWSYLFIYLEWGFIFPLFIQQV